MKSNSLNNMNLNMSNKLLWTMQQDSRCKSEYIFAVEMIRDNVQSILSEDMN
jgi:hypothetical protein